MPDWHSTRFLINAHPKCNEYHNFPCWISESRITEGPLITCLKIRLHANTEPHNFIQHVCGVAQRRYDMCHEMLTQRTFFATMRNTKRGTLSQHYVTHVVPIWVLLQYGGNTCILASYRAGSWKFWKLGGWWSFACMHVHRLIFFA